jgi:hypothetical protein
MTLARPLRAQPTMPDNPNLQRAEDRTRIDVNQEYERASKR